MVTRGIDRGYPPPRCQCERTRRRILTQTMHKSDPGRIGKGGDDNNRFVAFTGLKQQQICCLSLQSAPDVEREVPATELGRNGAGHQLEGAATVRADVMTGTHQPQASAIRIRSDSLHDEFTDHGNEFGVGSHARGANHVQAQFGRKGVCLRIEVVHHFHVVGDKANPRARRECSGGPRITATTIATPTSRKICTPPGAGACGGRTWDGFSPTSLTLTTMPGSRTWRNILSCDGSINTTGYPRRCSAPAFT